MSGTGGDSVRVAVRVRPFNGREKDRNAKLIIEMIDKMTIITNPHNNENKKFTFDFSYWSHDNYEEGADGMLIPVTDKYADQKHVFDTLGMDVLNNAYAGYNCSLFAYGQTGSGKSFSMVGYGVNKGIVPISCDTIFKGIADNTDPKLQYQVSLSMLEIYNEAVRDLLSKDPPTKGGLKVRQHPKLGVQVVGLLDVPVSSYDEINTRIEGGTSNRTVASTNMNATSSRAHTVVAIMYTKVEIDGKGPGKNRETTSKINLVDLAGSERAESTGATGDRLKEGAAINLSLTMLGNVIKALAEKSNNPKAKILVPYRDSKLTQILQDALGGNSKTIMIAALSPADINYEETLSTLRYADRAKQIKNKAIVNIDPTEMLIKKLKEENSKLMAQLKAFTEGGDIDFAALMAASGGGGDGGEGGAGGGGGGGGPMTAEEKEAMKKQLEEEMAAEIAANQAMLEEQAKSWEQRYKESMAQFSDADIAAKEEEEKRTRVPHLRNVNEDPALSHMVTRFVEGELTRVGRKDASVPPDVVLSGLSIQKEHAILRSLEDGRKVTLEVATEGAKVMLNGTQIEGTVELHNMDSIMFGANHLYYFVNPLTVEEEGAADKKPPTWEDAQEAIARAQGFAPSERADFASLTQAEQEAILIQDEIVKVLPLVNEANEIATELKRPMTFQVKMVNKLIGDKYKPEVGVIVRATDTDASWLWSSAKFRNRSFLMRELYQRVQEEGNVNVKQEEDPFWEPSEPVLVGVCNVYLAPLSYGVEFDDAVEIRDYKGKAEGIVQISIQPCTPAGVPLSDDDNFIEDASELIGKPLHLLIRVQHARGLNRKFCKGVQCKWNFYEASYETDIIKGTSNPDFKFQTVYEFARVDKKIVEYLESGLLRVEVWGEQDDGMRSSKGDTTLGGGDSASSMDGIKRLAEQNSSLEKKLNEIRDIVSEPKNKVPDDAKSKIMAVLDAN